MSDKENKSELSVEDWEMIYDALSNTVYPEEKDLEQQERILDYIAKIAIPEMIGEVVSRPWGRKEEGE